MSQHKSKTNIKSSASSRGKNASKTSNQNNNKKQPVPVVPTHTKWWFSSSGKAIEDILSLISTEASTICPTSRTGKCTKVDCSYSKNSPCKDVTKDAIFIYSSIIRSFCNAFIPNVTSAVNKEYVLENGGKCFTDMKKSPTKHGAAAAMRVAAITKACREIRAIYGENCSVLVVSPSIREVVYLHSLIPKAKIYGSYSASWPKGGRTSKFSKDLKSTRVLGNTLFIDMIDYMKIHQRNIDVVLCVHDYHFMDSTYLEILLASNIDVFNVHHVFPGDFGTHDINSQWVRIGDSIHASVVNANGGRDTPYVHPDPYQNTGTHCSQICTFGDTYVTMYSEDGGNGLYIPKNNYDPIFIPPVWVIKAVSSIPYVSMIGTDKIFKFLSDYFACRKGYIYKPMIDFLTTRNLVKESSINGLNSMFIQASNFIKTRHVVVPPGSTEYEFIHDNLFEVTNSSKFHGLLALGHNNPSIQQKIQFQSEFAKTSNSWYWKMALSTGLLAFGLAGYKLVTSGNIIKTLFDTTNVFSNVASFVTTKTGLEIKGKQIANVVDLTAPFYEELIKRTPLGSGLILGEFLARLISTRGVLQWSSIATLYMHMVTGSMPIVPAIITHLCWNIASQQGIIAAPPGNAGLAAGVAFSFLAALTYVIHQKCVHKVNIVQKEPGYKREKVDIDCDLFKSFNFDHATQLIGKENFDSCMDMMRSTPYKKVYFYPQIDTTSFERDVFMFQGNARTAVAGFLTRGCQPIPIPVKTHNFEFFHTYARHIAEQSYDDSYMIRKQLLHKWLANLPGGKAKQYLQGLDAYLDESRNYSKEHCVDVFAKVEAQAKGKTGVLFGGETHWDIEYSKPRLILDAKTYIYQMALLGKYTDKIFGNGKLGDYIVSGDWSINIVFDWNLSPKQIGSFYTTHIERFHQAYTTHVITLILGGDDSRCLLDGRTLNLDHVKCDRHQTIHQIQIIAQILTQYGVPADLTEAFVSEAKLPFRFRNRFGSILIPCPVAYTYNQIFEHYMPGIEFDNAKHVLTSTKNDVIFVKDKHVVLGGYRDSRTIYEIKTKMLDPETIPVVDGITVAEAGVVMDLWRAHVVQNSSVGVHRVCETTSKDPALIFKIGQYAVMKRTEKLDAMFIKTVTRAKIKQKVIRFSNPHGVGWIEVPQNQLNLIIFMCFVVGCVGVTGSGFTSKRTGFYALLAWCHVIWQFICGMEVSRQRVIQEFKNIGISVTVEYNENWFEEPEAQLDTGFLHCYWAPLEGSSEPTQFIRSCATIAKAAYKRDPCSIIGIEDPALAQDVINWAVGTGHLGCGLQADPISRALIKFLMANGKPNVSDKYLQRGRTYVKNTFRYKSDTECSSAKVDEEWIFYHWSLRLGLTVQEIKNSIEELENFHPPAVLQTPLFAKLLIADY